MRLLDRYLLRELIIPLGYCLGGLVMVYVAFDLIPSLNRLQEHELLARDVVELYLVKLPAIFVFILPISLLLSLLHTLTNLSRHHELTAIRAAGVSLWRLCMPYLVVGVLLSLTAFALNELWVPDSEAKQAEIMGRRLNSPGVDRAVVSKLGFRNTRDGHNWIIGAYYPNTGLMINPHVDWSDGGTNWDLQSRSAQRINDVWTFYGSTIFVPGDIINLEGLAARLKTPADPLSQFVSSQLSQSTRSLLSRALNSPDVDLQRALTDDLNHIVYHGTLFEEQRFASVKLPPSTADFIAQKPQGNGLFLLNRMLLVAAYPQELSKNSINTVRLMKGDSNQMAASYTNILAMPQFSETPNEFANEAKFTSRFAGKLSDDSADIPILEIRDYLKVHPDSTKKQWLLTQLHARFAAPWSCLVVVLIAIPFGAASGRRNIFVGVAGSIVICFIYFILLRLGLALGTGGFVAPWLAAWLPNAAFGITGFLMILRVR